MQFTRFEKIAAATVLAMAGLFPGMSAQAADVVVVVSAKSGVGSLTADQVSQIFLAKSMVFPNGEAATPVDLSGGAERDAFYSKVTGKDASQLKAYWSQLVFTGKAKPPKSLAGSADVVKEVAANPKAIGYVSKSAVDASVKVVLTP